MGYHLFKGGKRRYWVLNCVQVPSKGNDDTTMGKECPALKAPRSQRRVLTWGPRNAASCSGGHRQYAEDTEKPWREELPKRTGGKVSELRWHVSIVEIKEFAWVEKVFSDSFTLTLAQHNGPSISWRLLLLPCTWTLDFCFVDFMEGSDRRVSWLII